MKIKFLFYSLILIIPCIVSAQTQDIPVRVILKKGDPIDAIHFGKNKCTSNSYAENFILIRGKYKGIVTEIKDFSDIQKIVLIGYTKEPLASVGNEKGTLQIVKKNGVTVDLDEAELVPSCTSVGDKYNQISVKIMNPLTEQPVDQLIEIRNIQSILFK